MNKGISEIMEALYLLALILQYLLAFAGGPADYVRIPELQHTGKLHIVHFLWKLAGRRNVEAD